MIGRLPFSATHCGHLRRDRLRRRLPRRRAWLDDVIAVLDHNRSLLAELLAAHLPEVGYAPPQAGYLAWLDLRALDLGDDPSDGDPRARPGRAQPGAELRPPGRRLRAAEHRHLTGPGRGGGRAESQEWPAVADVAAGPNRREPERGPLELESRRWLEALERETGPLSLFDTHTHFGHNDPDGCRQEPQELLATIERAGARAVTFPMHEPDGYPPANDEALALAEASGGRLVPFCRVDPHDGALAEARRCLDARRSRDQAASPRRAVRHARARGRGAGVTGKRAAGPGPDPCGPRHPRLGARHGPPGRAIPGRAPDPRPCGGQRHCLAVAADAGASEPAYRHFLVEPGRSDRALLPRAPRPDPLGERFAVRGALGAAPLHLRCALAAGLDSEAIASIAGGQIERILAGEEPADVGPPPGPPGPLDPCDGADLSRTCSPRSVGLSPEGDVTESVALARLACDVEGEHGAVCEEVIHLLDLAERHVGPPPPGRLIPTSMWLLVLALCVARTPDVALPEDDRG